MKHKEVLEVQLPKHFPAIDVLRAFAALAVVACHCIVVGGWPSEPLGLLPRFARYGWLGVDLFFVISGFVITSSALKLREAGWRTYMVAFWVRRAARIVPLYYVTLVAFLILVDHSALGGAEVFKQVVTHILLVHQWWPETAGSINGVTWTLGIEVLFYLVAWILVGFRLVRIGGGGAYLALLIAGSITYRLVLFHSLTVEPQRIFWSNQVFGLLDGFAMGAALAVWPGAQCSSSGGGVLSWMKRWYLAVIGLLMLMISLWIVDTHLDDFWKQPYIVGAFRTQVGLAFACLVLWAVRWPQQQQLVRPLVFLGKISYGIYLWHLLLLLWLQKWMKLSDSSLIVGTLLLTLLIAITSHFLVELPCQRWASRLLSRSAHRG